MRPSFGTNLPQIVTHIWQKAFFKHALGWWEDCADSEEDLIINLVDDKLRDALDNEKSRTILRRITDYEEYNYFCFEDHDFLPSQLSNMVMMYLRNPELVETFLQYDNLDDYLDLMECDLRERYLEVRHMSENRNHTSLTQNIIMELCSAIRRFQKRIPHFEERDEVQITADLHDSVEGFDEIENELKTIDGDFAPINIKRIGESEILMIVSEHIVPETGNKMKVYHLIFQLNDKERKEVAALARKNRAKHV